MHTVYLNVAKLCHKLLYILPFYNDVCICSKLHTVKRVIGDGKMNEYSQKRPLNILVDIETLGLSAKDKDSKIIAIGVFCGGFREVLIGKNEKTLLQKFWNLPFFHQYSRVIGFNILDFDLPFLIIRSYIHNVNIPPNIRGKVIDLRHVLNCGNRYSKGTLEDFGKLILGGKGMKNGHSGEDIRSLWEQGKYDEIKSYCYQDVWITSKILERLECIGVV